MLTLWLNHCHGIKYAILILVFLWGQFKNRCHREKRGKQYYSSRPIVGTHIMLFICKTPCKSFTHEVSSPAVWGKKVTQRRMCLSMLRGILMMMHPPLMIMTPSLPVKQQQQILFFISQSPRVLALPSKNVLLLHRVDPSGPDWVLCLNHNDECETFTRPQSRPKKKKQRTWPKEKKCCLGPDETEQFSDPLQEVKGDSHPKITVKLEKGEMRYRNT